MSISRQKPEFTKKSQEFQSLPKIDEGRKIENNNFSSPCKNNYYLSKEVKLNNNYNSVSEFSFKKSSLQNSAHENKAAEKYEKYHFATENTGRYSNIENFDSSSLMNSKIFYNMKNKMKDEKKKLFFSENGTKNSDEKIGFQFESLQVFMKSFRDVVKGTENNQK